MAAVAITESSIRRTADPLSYKRGESYALSGRVRDLTSTAVADGHVHMHSVDLSSSVSCLLQDGCSTVRQDVQRTHRVHPPAPGRGEALEGPLEVGARAGPRELLAKPVRRPAPGCPVRSNHVASSRDASAIAAGSRPSRERR